MFGSRSLIEPTHNKNINVRGRCMAGIQLAAYANAPKIGLIFPIPNSVHPFFFCLPKPALQFV